MEAIFAVFDETRPSVPKLGIPFVPMTTLTMDEMAPIASRLGLRGPMIVEAGGAIARCNGVEWELEACGPASDTLLDVIRVIEERTGAQLRVFEQQRSFSEPFVIERGALSEVKRAAASIGYDVLRDRGMFHLIRRAEKAGAFTRLRDDLRCEVAIAIGDSPLHAAILARADVAIVLPGRDGKPDAELLAKVRHARVARSRSLTDEWLALAVRRARPPAAAHPARPDARA